MLYVTGSSNWVLWDRLERRDGVGSEKEVKEGRTYMCLWLIHVDVWQKPTQYCKEIILQLKRNKFEERLMCETEKKKETFSLKVLNWNIDIVV